MQLLKCASRFYDKLILKEHYSLLQTIPNVAGDIYSGCIENSLNSGTLSIVRAYQVINAYVLVLRHA